MARIRTIKPEFFTSSDIIELSPIERLVFISLWCEADREGRLKWNPKTLKFRYFPADDCDIDDIGSRLIELGLISIYKVGSKEYAEVCNFHMHQVINNRESESSLPSISDASSTRESGVKVEGKGRERKGKEGKGREHAITRFDDFWTVYPKGHKSSKKKALDKWIAKRLDDIADKIIHDVEDRIERDTKWLAGFIPDVLTYINQERWDGDICLSNAQGSSHQGGSGPDEWAEEQTRATR